jgi:hypothetical protein
MDDIVSQAGQEEWIVLSCVEQVGWRKRSRYDGTSTYKNHLSFLSADILVNETGFCEKAEVKKRPMHNFPAHSFEWVE